MSVFDIDRNAKPRAVTSDMGFWKLDDATMYFAGIDYGHAPSTVARVVVASTPSEPSSDNPFQDLILAYVEHVREAAAKAADYDRAILLGSVRSRPWVELPVFEPVEETSTDVRERPRAVVR